MPPTQRGSAYRTAKGEWGVRWYENGSRRKKAPFPTRSAALAHFDDIVRPRLGLGMPERDITFDELCDRYLRVHAVSVEAATIQTLTDRLKRPRKMFGDVELRRLERMAMEIADFRATIPAGSRHGVTQAVRQVLAAAVRWRLIIENPAVAAGANPQPRRGELRPFESHAEIDKIALELGWKPEAGKRNMKGAILVFACETGLMPEEWIALERRDISRRDGILLIQRSYTARGGLKEYGKTARRRRRVPLSARAIAVLDELPARLNTRLIFPAPGRGPGVKTGQGGYLDLHNYRARDWLPAFDAAGVPRRRIYDTRHTFATFALHAGLSLFEVARYMGTSVRMIDLTYGHLVKGAEDQARAKLDLLTFGDTADQADQADQAAESDS